MQSDAQTGINPFRVHRRFLHDVIFLVQNPGNRIEASFHVTLVAHEVTASWPHDLEPSSSSSVRSFTDGDRRSRSREYRLAACAKYFNPVLNVYMPITRSSRLSPPDRQISRAPP